MKISTFDIMIWGILIILTTTIGVILLIYNHSSSPVIGEESILYIATDANNKGCLMKYDVKKQSSLCLTEEDVIVNSYVVSQNKTETKVFFFGVKKTSLNNPYFHPEEYQDLYQFNPTTLRQKKISSSDEFSHDRILLSQDGKYLFVRKSEKKSSQSEWWIFDTEMRKWKKWNQGKALVDLHLSPDGKTILAADAMSNVGYIMLPFKEEEKNETLVGNFDECFGFNFRGDTILCKKQKDDDVMSSENYLLIFHADGTSEKIFENEGVNIKTALWSKTEDSFFVVIKNNDQQKEEIFSVDINTKKRRLLFETYTRDILTLEGDKKNLLFVSQIKNNALSFSADRYDITKIKEEYKNADKKYLIQGYNLISQTRYTFGLEGISPSFLSF